MSFATTLDRLVDTSDYAFKYSGHLDWDTIQIPADPTTTTTSPSRSNKVTFEDCAKWIREPCAVSRPARLRLLLITTIHPVSNNSLSHKREEPHATQRQAQIRDVEKLFHDTGLPIAGFAAYVKTLLSFAQVPCSLLTAAAAHGEEAVVARYYYSSPSWGLTWSHCTTTGHTKAVLLCRETVKARLMAYLQSVLVPLERFIDHPMLLGYMIIEFTLAELCSVLLETSNEILGLEKNTGLSAWDWVSEHEIPGTHTPSNYEYTSKRLSVLSGKVTHIRFRLHTLQQYNKSVHRIAQKHKSTVMTKDPFPQQQQQLRCEEIEDILAIMSEYTDVRLHKADSLRERLDNQVSGMANIIGQRDTSAMKTVAIVTMVFLPGTFVASFFAMPMLNWDAAAYSRIVNRRFWIYWIVTVPLTVAVFALWWARQKIKARKEKQAHEERAVREQGQGQGQGKSGMVEDVVSRRRVFPKGALIV